MNNRIIVPHQLKRPLRSLLILVLLTASAILIHPAQSEARVIIRVRPRPVRTVRIKRPVVVVKTPVVKVKVVRPVKEKEVWIPGHYRKVPGRRAVWVPGHWKLIKA